MSFAQATRKRDGPSEAPSLQSTLRTVQETNQIAARTLDTLHAQDEQVQKIKEDVAVTKENLNGAQRLLNGLKPWGFFRTLISAACRDTTTEQAPVATRAAGTEASSAGGNGARASSGGYPSRSSSSGGTPGGQGAERLLAADAERLLAAEAARTPQASGGRPNGTSSEADRTAQQAQRAGVRNGRPVRRMTDDAEAMEGIEKGLGTLGNMTEEMLRNLRKQNKVLGELAENTSDCQEMATKLNKELKRLA